MSVPLAVRRYQQWNTSTKISGKYLESFLMEMKIFHYDKSQKRHFIFHVFTSAKPLVIRQWEIHEACTNIAPNVWFFDFMNIKWFPPDK